MEQSALTTITLFASLPAEELETISKHVARTQMSEGRHIAQEGDFAYKFFGILSGTATVVVNENVVATLTTGDVFGEMALIQDDLRNASVIADTDLDLVTMASWDFRDARASCPTFKAAIDRIIASRS